MEQSKIAIPPDQRLEMALAEALPKLEAARKNSNNPHFKSKYADLGAVIEAIRPAAEHGIWFRQVLHEGPEGVTVETLYTGFGATISAGTLFMPAAKRDAQGFGSALTYARRYSLQTAFGLSTEDDDGNAAVKSAPEAMPEAEYTKIVQLVETTNTNVQAMFKALGIRAATLKDMNLDEYNKAVAALNDKLAKMAKAESNKEAEHA